MSSAAVLADRADIHKSCKSIELLLNILNDYCQVADALVSLQKKLAKALRDAAATKATASIPASALLTSAVVFDALSEVDSKFVKLADKECDSISSDVRKWFKKLAKEEKAHDDKVASANAKIKQAGQLYEKKSKKSPRDAQEEHTRYITLLSVLGPEVTQEKYDHSLSVTKRHTTILHGVASALSRVADAEWLRSCEQVRRVSPAVGQLGEWRSLCEGGWTGPIPQDLPLLDPAKATLDDKESEDQEEPSLDRPVPEYSSRGPSEQERVQNAQVAVPAKGNTLTSPPPQYSSPNLQSAQADETQLRDRSRPETTLASLAAFPAPPTHLPLPPFTPVAATAPPTPTKTESPVLRHIQPHSNGTSDSKTDSAASEGSPLTRTIPPSPAVEPLMPKLAPSSVAPANVPLSASVSAASSNPSMSKYESRPEETTSTGVAQPRVLQENAPLTESPNPSVHHPERQSQENADIAEFGVKKREDGVHRGPELSRAVERTDTGRSSGSMVAALRDKYARNPDLNATSPKDVVRLPLSVSSLASRYDSSTEQPSSPRSPDRRRLSADQSTRMPVQGTVDRSTYTSNNPGSPAAGDNLRPSHRSPEDFGQTLSERERQLRWREEDIERKTRELEYERMRIQRDGELHRFPGSSSPHVNNAFVVTPHLHQQYSYSTASLNTQLSMPPSMPTTPTHYTQRLNQLQPPVGAVHAPSCGCEACSASKYRTRDIPPSPRDLRPPEPPITLRPEKPKGWIRRLSMPVMGNAFSSDSKKGIANLATPSNVMGTYRTSLALPDEAGRLQYDAIATKNRSTATLGR